MGVELEINTKLTPFFMVEFTLNPDSELHTPE